MSFSDREKLMQLVEELIVFCWLQEFGSIQLPFPQITFADSMEKYGVDAPDLLIPFQVQFSFNIYQKIK